MNAPRLISPMLDGFLLGEVFSNHGGNQCCPVLHQRTGDRFVLKMISFPASHAQADALLFSGAYLTQSAVRGYFLDKVREVHAETRILRQLTAAGGFTDFDRIQVVPNIAGDGYELYLLSPYQQSLQRLMKSGPMTHLSVVNLGLDLCAALSACRQEGYLYVNLKPTNIYCGDQGFRIGDLGFAAMKLVGNGPVPEQYRSVYTAPELQDPLSSLNETVDTYALGLILYQACNGGVLPEATGGDYFAPPQCADAELADIILRACSRKPAQRYHTPEQMGQDLTRYLQKNSVNDTPLIPAPKPAEVSIEIPQIEKEEIEPVQQTITEDKPRIPRPRRRPVPKKKSRWPIAIAVLLGVLVIELILGLSFLLK